MDNFKSTGGAQPGKCVPQAGSKGRADEETNGSYHRQGETVDLELEQLPKPFVLST